MVVDSDLVQVYNAICLITDHVGLGGPALDGVLSGGGSGVVLVDAPPQGQHRPQRLPGWFRVLPLGLKKQHLHEPDLMCPPALYRNMLNSL